MASKEVADLVRKAWNSIIDDPASWNQASWIAVDEQGCKTTFCLGGWMMIHAGYRQAGHPGGFRGTWFEDDHGHDVDINDIIDGWVEDIHGRDQDDTVFRAHHGTLPKLRAAIEAAGIILDPIPQQAETDWDAQFDKDIDFFVDLCVKAGDRITGRQVRSDEILMGLLRTIRRNGRREGKAETPANAGVLEAQHLLKIEQRHSERLRGELSAEKNLNIVRGHEHDRAMQVLRNEIEDLRIKASGSPKVRDETLQRALTARTRQAREAGQAAREARAQVRARDATIEGLTALVDGQEGAKALRDLLEDANRKIEILKIRMSLIRNYSEIGGL